MDRSKAGKTGGTPSPERHRPPKPIPLNPPMTRSAVIVGAVIVASWLLGKVTASCKAPEEKVP